MSDKPLGSVQPGDSKSTADKLTGDTKAVGQNILDTGSHYADKTGATNTASDASKKAESFGQNVVDTGKHYADKTGATDTANQASAKAESIGQNVADTGKNYADKAEKEIKDANNSTPAGEKTYLEQAQGVAVNVLNTASKAASDLASSISGEQKK